MTETDLWDRLELMERIIAAYDAAADKFIHKVDTGQARSVETYRDLQAARALSRQREDEHTCR